MKKILFAAIPLLAVLLTTSCSNDDIVVNTVGPKHKLSVNVSTKGIYEQFEIDSYVFNNYLHPNTQNIGVITLVYNDEGTYVGGKKSHTPTYNNVTHSYELEVGKRYTIITIETLVNPDNDYNSDAWDVSITKQLSALQLKPKDVSSIFDVVGVNITEVLLKNDVSLNITPEAIGSRINFWPYNFKNAYVVINEAGNITDNGKLDKITKLNLGTYSNLNYYSLNPSLNAKDRFVKKLTEEKVFHSVTDFDLSDGLIDGYYSYGYVVDSDAEFNFYVHHESQEEGWYRGVNSEKISLENGKTYHAGFCYITPIDKTSISTRVGIFDDYDRLQEWAEIVKPVTGLYKEPYTTWGESVTTVKNYMSGYNGSSIVDDNSGRFCLWYYGKNQEEEIDYWFESQIGGLEFVYVFLDPTTVGEDDIEKYFNDLGYTYLGAGDGFKVYDKDESTRVEVGMNSQNKWLILYYNPMSFAKEHKSPKSIRAYVPKQEVLRLPSEIVVGEDEIVAESKFIKSEKENSVKNSR